MFVQLQIVGFYAGPSVESQSMVKYLNNKDILRYKAMTMIHRENQINPFGAIRMTIPYKQKQVMYNNRNNMKFMGFLTFYIYF